MVDRNTGWLSGWKQIARYCDCCVATAKKYAKINGMPVRKPFGNKITAIPSELDEWLKNKK